ncbi:MAG: hypothetical protein ACSI46_25140 [Gloeotrichia echinulata DVL01]|jgi:hypothetical protein|nr:hypothetical protein [Gloeotrichia echinulata DEX184]
MTDQEVITPALAMARRSLQILEEQAAGFDKLSIPGHLRIQLEEKRREVAESLSSPQHGNGKIFRCGIKKWRLFFCKESSGAFWHSFTQMIHHI